MKAFLEQVIVDSKVDKDPLSGLKHVNISGSFSFVTSGNADPFETQKHKALDAFVSKLYQVLGSVEFDIETKETKHLKELEELLNVNAFWSNKYDSLSNPDDLARMVLDWIKTKKDDLFTNQ